MERPGRVRLDCRGQIAAVSHPNPGLCQTRLTQRRLIEWPWRSQDLMDGEFQRRQITLDGQPDCQRIDTVVLMSQPISDAPNIIPRNARQKLLGIITESARRFAQNQELSLHRSTRLFVCLESGEIYTLGEPLD
jgi:hypothetical protein